MTTSSGTLSWFKSESPIRIIQLVAGAIIVGIIFRKLQFSTSAICCGDFDGYYHIKWTQTLWESIKSGHFRPSFPWLPLTTLNSKDYVDHHLLFHIFQIPFAVSPDPRMGAKIASALFGSLAVLSCYWLLLRYRVRYALVWLIALLGCSAPFLFRMNMARRRLSLSSTSSSRFTCFLRENIGRCCRWASSSRGPTTCLCC